MQQIDLEKLYRVSREDIEKDFDAVLEKVDSGISPILIRSVDCPDLLLFGWDDYLAQFGCLYTAEEIAAIEEACKKCGENE